MKPRTLIQLAWLTVLLATTSCAGYRLGPTGGFKAGEKSVQVSFFKNETLEPRIVEAVNQSLRKQFQKEGTFRLETQQGGDLIVTGKITQLLRNGLSYRSTDVLAVADFSMMLSAEIIVIERVSGREVFSKKVTSTIPVSASGDLVSQELRVLPLISDELARKAVNLLADGAW